MRNNPLLLFIVGVSTFLIGLTAGILLCKQHNTNPEAYKRMRTNISHPDTLLGYWDEGALYIIFKQKPSPSDSEEVVEEVNL